MKVHNDLKDLFCDPDYINRLRKTLSNSEWRRLVKEWSQNKLALGKPRPLTKNKQGLNKKTFCPQCEDTIEVGESRCGDCKWS